MMNNSVVNEFEFEVDILNLQAIAHLEKIGLIEPTEKQIELMERILSSNKINYTLH